jgi:hypothetical protein
MVVGHTRDAASRLIARSEGTITTHYGFAGADRPAFAMGADNVVAQRFVALAGGAMVTKQSSGAVWSYPNVHGDVVATANAADTKQGTTVSFDPFGQSVTVPDNAPSNLDYGWLGPASHRTRRRHHRRGRGGSTRKALDNLLFNDFRAVCGGVSWWRRPGCGISARAGYEIVSGVSWTERYGVPR